ncbi:hypothetical protein BGW39_011378 [Mortierella sp. 14UC]|nr:hypothetical protein BGW39_011378 [Mortierella sp. 14UC]
MNQHIYLRVVIDGDNVKDSFTVPTEVGALVADLQSAIKRHINDDVKFSNNALCDVPTERLELWWLGLPWPYPFHDGKVIEFEGNEEILLSELPTKRRLGLAERVADVFHKLTNTTVERRVFVVVKVAQVKQLRRAIKVAIATDQQFRQSSLRDIAIDRLQLWRALLPDPCHCESNFSEFAKDELVLLDILKTKCKLELHQTLGDVFDDHIQLGGKVFIVVKCED